MKAGLMPAHCTSAGTQSSTATCLNPWPKGVVTSTCGRAGSGISLTQFLALCRRPSCVCKSKHAWGTEKAVLWARFQGCHSAGGSYS